MPDKKGMERQGCIELKLCFFTKGLDNPKQAWLEGAGFRMNQEDNPGRGINGNTVNGGRIAKIGVLQALQNTLDAKQIEILDKHRKKVDFTKI